MNNDQSSFFQKAKAWVKKHPFITIIGILIFLAIVGAIGGDRAPADTQAKAGITKDSESTAKETENPVATKEAQDELDSFMKTSKDAKLITSYEFSDSAVVVYVDQAWYGQTVQFKKDFIAKIGLLKKAVTGYTHFEVKDAYSNEKVGEIKAFSQSIEVYK